MHKLSLFLAGALSVMVIALFAAGIFVMRARGFSAREVPSALERWIARRARTMAAPSDVSVSAQDLQHQSQALDVLPPVAGADALDVDDSSILPAAPENPWELEGLDWPAVETLLTALPMATQLNFVEFTLDTEDWYEVGKRLAHLISVPSGDGS